MLDDGSPLIMISCFAWCFCARKNQPTNQELSHKPATMIVHNNDSSFEVESYFIMFK